MEFRSGEQGHSNLVTPSISKQVLATLLIREGELSCIYRKESHLFRGLGAKLTKNSP